MDITINGEKLTDGQAMTVHVAIQSFLVSLRGEEFPLGDDEHGLKMTKAHLDNIDTINVLLLKGN